MNSRNKQNIRKPIIKTNQKLKNVDIKKKSENDNENIILNRIVQNGMYYGDLYYDIQKNGLYYKNKYGSIYDVTSNTKNNSIFSAVYLNSVCCVHYDEHMGVSTFDTTRCSHNHITINESNTYNYTKIPYVPQIYIRTFYVNLNDTKVYEYDEYNGYILLKEIGHYKVTYNITYHGSINEVIFGIITKTENKSEEIPFSINKSRNRCICDTKEDTYYDENNDDNKIEEIMTTVNHTFMFLSKESCNIQILIKLGEKNKDKTIYIHPLNTWILIEKIN